jgi:L-lactate dehydrogenase complex protein LldF
LASRIGVRAIRMFGKAGWISRLPLAGGWTTHRDMPRPTGRTFMEQYRAEQAKKGGRP